MDKVVRDAVRRIGRRSVAWWRTETPHGRTRADAVGELVGDLAALAQAVEGAAERRRPARPPREDVLVDQLTVVAHDLVTALRERPDAGAATEATEATKRTLDEVDPR